MALSLTITDLQNGLGAGATVAGADGGAASSIYAVNVLTLTDYNPMQPWSSVASLTGNGTVTLPLVPGYYWAYCQSLVGGVTTLTPPAYFSVTRFANAVLTQIRNSVQAKIQGLNLLAADANGKQVVIPANQVYVLQAPYDLAVQYPAILLTDEGEQETIQERAVPTVDTDYPVKVMVADRTDVLDSVRMPLYEKWRETCILGFQGGQRLPGLPAAWCVGIRPKLIFDPRLPQYQMVVSGFTAVFRYRRPRAG